VVSRASQKASTLVLARDGADGSRHYARQHRRRLGPRLELERDRHEARCCDGIGEEARRRLGAAADHLVQDADPQGRAGAAGEQPIDECQGGAAGQLPVDAGNRWLDRAGGGRQGQSQATRHEREQMGGGGADESGSRRLGRQRAEADDQICAAQSVAQQQWLEIGHGNVDVLDRGHPAVGLEVAGERRLEGGHDGIRRGAREALENHDAQRGSAVLMDPGGQGAGHRQSGQKDSNTHGEHLKKMGTIE
jgi:hypothetical protein